MYYYFGKTYFKKIKENDKIKSRRIRVAVPQYHDYSLSLVKFHTRKLNLVEAVSYCNTGSAANSTEAEN